MDKSDFTVSLEGTKIKFDCVFNAIHGAPGEDGTMQAYFELLSLPHTGCNMYQAALTFNKRDCLSTLKPYGIISADAYFLNAGDYIDSAAIEAAVGFPCFVKANKSGSSIGVYKVNHKKNLISSIENSFKIDNEVLIESFLNGIEVSVGVMNYKNEIIVLGITQLITENDFFDYEAKYQGKSKEITPANISEIQKNNVTEMAIKIYKKLGLKGFSRSEFIFVGDIPYFLELNSIPGMTNESIFPKQAEVNGISLKDLCSEVIAQAVK